MDRKELDEFISKKSSNINNNLKNNNKKLNFFRKRIMPETLDIINIIKVLKSDDEKNGKILFTSILLFLLSQYSENTDEMLDILNKLRYTIIDIETEFNKK